MGLVNHLVLNFGCSFLNTLVVVIDVSKVSVGNCLGKLV